VTAASGSRLGGMLVRAGVITEEQLRDALISMGAGSLVSALVSHGVTTDVRIAQAIAGQYVLDYVDLGAAEIDHTASLLISPELARRHRVLPVGFDDDVLLVAMVDPSDILALDDVRIVTGRDVRPIVVTEAELMPVIDRVANMQQDVDEMFGGIGGDELVDEAVQTEEVADEEAPVAKMLSAIISEAIRQGAGDIYIEPFEQDVRVRYRVDGVCREVMRSPKRFHRQLISRIKIDSGMDIAERRIPQDGRFGVVFDGKAVDFRVAVLPAVNGEMSVMRLLHRESIMLSLEDLGFLEKPMNTLLDALAKPYGAILVTGPTGSGKSTTLYAAINKTTRPTVNLITVEDPVEYRLEGLSQVQVHEKAGLTFAAALRSILRQDPDVVMVGEIRDKETATIAIEAALTGHLVLSTLHTNDAPSALTRLTEMGVEPFLSASAINCVLAQRLARRLCPDCKEAYTPSAEALDRVGFPYDPDNIPTLYRARGCTHCSNVGYKGRMGIHEVMTIGERIERACVNHASGDEIKRLAVEEGMLTLRHDGFEKARMGFTSIEEVLRVVV
jgi:type IV pilus assembly protein PilB